MCKIAWQEIIENLYILRKDICPDGNDKVHLPVNLKRLIWNAQKMFKCEPHKKRPSKLDPKHIIQKVQEIGKKIVVRISGRAPGVSWFIAALQCFCLQLICLKVLNLYIMHH